MNHQVAKSLNRNLRVLLQEVQSRLRPAERRIATFLLEEGEAYSDFTLSQLSSLGGASEAAVVRMCKEMGLKGFRPFRLRWVQEAAGRAARRTEVSTELSSIYTALDETEPLLAESLTAAAEALVTSERVFVYGSGGSGLVAELAATELSMAGRLSVAFRTDLSGSNSLSYIERSSSVLVISHRGKNEILEKVLRRAREVGSASVVLTSGAGSTLAQLGDILLLTGGAVAPGSDDAVMCRARVVQLAAAHALAQEVSERITRYGDTNSTMEG